MVPAPKMEVATTASVVQLPARTSSKQPLLKSKYFQTPSRASYTGTGDLGAIGPDPGSPTLLSTPVKLLDASSAINGNAGNGAAGAQSPDADPVDMGFDTDLPPSSAMSKRSNHVHQLSVSSGRASASPRTSSESIEPRSGSKASHRRTPSGGHIADISMTVVPPRKPVREDSQRSASADTPTLTVPSRPAESIRKISDAAPTLRPIAYSPEPGTEGYHGSRQPWNQESRASWHIGDDNPDREPVAKPAEARPEPERKPSTMLMTPPRLPLLFFEQESIDQMDFAYKDPRPAASRLSAAQTQLDPGRDEQKALPVTDKKRTSARLAEEDDQLPDDSPQLPNLPPLDTSLSFDSNKKRAEDEELERPNTEQGAEKTVEEKSKAEEDPSTPQQHDKAEESESFYWNSPRSSTEEEARETEDSDRDEAPIDTPPDEEEQNTTTPRKPASPEQPPSPKKVDPVDDSETLVSASALGYGGPSDWEHFGNYNAEEVDDIEFYTSPKTKEPPTTLPASLNATAVQEVEVEPDEDDVTLSDIDEPNNIPQRPFLERKILSTIEERASENLEDIFGERQIEDHNGQSINAREIFGNHPPPPPPRDVYDSRDPDTLPPQPGDGNLQSRQSAASSSAETIERISFHVPPPPESTTSETSSISPESDDLNFDEPTPRMGMPSVTDLAPKEPRSPLGAEATTPKPIPPPIPEDSASTAETEARSETVSQGVKTRQTSSVLSPTSEDGQELITISLEFPPQLDNSDQQGMGDESLASDLRGGSRRSVYPGSIPLENPYAHLEAWARASLNRYVKVLHDEARAKSNEDKYRIFVNFMHNEQRNRAVFYDQDDESEVSDIPIAQPMPRANRQSNVPNSGPLRISKALPALPSEPESTPLGSPAQVASPPPIVEESGSGKASLRSVNAAQAAEARSASPLAAVQRTDTPNSGRLGEREETESPALEDEKSRRSLRGVPSLNALRKALDIVTTRKSSLTSKDSQAIARASIAQAAGQPTRAEFAGDAKSPNSAASPVNGMSENNGNRESLNSPAGDTDAEFSQNEGKPYEGDKAANRQSIYQPFSTMLRQSSVRSAFSDAGERRTSHQTRGVSGTYEGEETKKSAQRTKKAKASKPPSYRYTVLEPLLSVVPQESVLRHEPEQLIRLRQGIDAIPDDYSFIHKTVLAWDADAKKARERYDLERHQRQGQNEQRIDDLFNEHEIAYADISRLEADFKRAEAKKKAEEDREEVDTFVESVFNVVWARINYEMDQLTPLYEECTRLVAGASAGRDMFDEDTTARVPIAPAMEALLILYQKLMGRHQKAFEAVLERDRRLKKVEVAPWYALGAVDKVKRIEKRFEDAEKRAILEFCRQRDERANLLMDVLNQNTLRGVGANQDYMESMMQAVRTVTTQLVGGGAVGEEDMVSTNEVLKAKTITTALARSSEQIVQTFHVADMLLNAADYEVSVANAKLNAADTAAFKRLREAKGKEDHKLELDLEHRMGLIRGDTVRTQDEITKLLMLIQDRRSSATAAEAIAEGGMDPEREQRLRKALDEVAATSHPAHGEDA